MIRLVRWLGIVVVLSVVGTVGALGAFATTAAPARTPPTCKPAQKSTKAKPCIPGCRTGQKSTKARPCAKTPRAITITFPLTVPARPLPPPGPGGTPSPGTTSQPAQAGNTPPPLSADNCPDGTVIPESANAGDEDDDNESGFPSDGDGCL